MKKEQEEANQAEEQQQTHASAIDYRLQKKEGMEFLHFGFGQDTSFAPELVRKILREVFGVPERVRLFARLENASPWDELITQ